MGETEKTELKLFKDTVRALRSSEYGNQLDLICRKLNLPDNTNRADIEALLIYATEERFYGNETLKRDRVLADFGLLRGYSNQRGLSRGDEFRKAVTERRKKFLKESNYILKECKKYGSWENIEAQENVLETVIGTLGKKNGAAIDTVAQRLYNKTDKESFLAKAIAKYNKFFHTDYIPDEELPVLLNVRDDGPAEDPLLADAEQSANDDSIDLDDESEEYEPEEFMGNEPKSLLIPSFLLKTRKSPEASPLPPKAINQFIKISHDAFWDDPRDDELSEAAYLAGIQEERKKRWLMAFKICLLLSGCLSFTILILSSTIYAKEIGEKIGKYLYYGLIIMFLMVLSLGLVCLFLKKSWTLSERKRKLKMHRSYTVQQIKSGILGKRIVLNSISDGSASNGYKGDERKFMSVKKVGDESGEWQYGNINVENGDEYLIRVFVHNDNPNGYDAVAKYCRVEICLPDTSSKKVQVCGIISSNNARPREYWDSITFCNVSASFRLVHLRFDRLYNNGIGQEGYPLSQRVTDPRGAFIGYDHCDGEIPGGDGYESNVLLRMRVEFDNYFIVKFKGNDSYMFGGWWDIVEADVWDTVNFQIGYKNSSNAKEPQKNVTVSVDLPECLRYVPYGVSLSIFPRPAFDNNKTYDYDNLFLPSGLDIGNFDPGVSVTILFRAEIIDRGLCPGRNEFSATLKVSVGEVTKYDSVNMIANKEPSSDFDED